MTLLRQDEIKYAPHLPGVTAATFTSGVVLNSKLEDSSFVL